MSDSGDPGSAALRRRFRLRRLAPALVVVVLIGAAYFSGLHRELTLENLIRHRTAIDDFIATHTALALAIFFATYVVAVALSIPVALYLTVTSGLLFGPIVGPAMSIVSSTTGATVLFLVAQTAVGDFLVRRAGPAVEKLADGFRADAFHYLLFLRLVPVFPFWLVNLAPALFGVKLRTFVLATLIGGAPAAIAFSFVGSSLDSVLAAQQAAYKACVASGQAGCKLNFDVRDAVTPELIAGLAALGAVALIPIVLRGWRRRRMANAPCRQVNQNTETR